MPLLSRRKTPSVRIGRLQMGADHPVVVQSMTDTPTADEAATWAQTVALIEAGAEMVRWTVNDDAAALAAVRVISRLRSSGIETPIVGDFHFNGHLLLEKYPDLAGALDKYRINPGNVGRGLRHDENFARIIAVAVRHKKPVRIGVNGGSLDQEIHDRIARETPDLESPNRAREIMVRAVVESAVESARYAMELGLPLERIVLSAKMSSVDETIDAYERIAAACDHALHLGLTEAGGGMRGIVGSTAALAVLLRKGIGDTVRVSLTPEPGIPRTREVEVCQEILQSLGLRDFVPSVVSCPGCGRTQSVLFQELARDIRTHVSRRMPEWRKIYPGIGALRIAVMGCVVNGPGESRHADIGISLPGAMEDPAAPVYVDGKRVALLRGNAIYAEFTGLLEKYVAGRFGK
ncbi:MAG: flavodoxin-dependent (E)-4-hydroxy-3-methylbut-2-enyl-diphosphate synthase [Elusimicrobia bacterium]|nr:flavodoxin-dependent (E)-4-hydroxy-3-methylbut-2-enyl-diphosphate synthase [Elusimicrobiota bacterium]